MGKTSSFVGGAGKIYHNTTRNPATSTDNGVRPVVRVGLSYFRQYGW